MKTGRWPRAWMGLTLLLLIAPQTTVASITVTPADSLISLGQTIQFTATETLADGSTRVLTSGGNTWMTLVPMPTARTGLAVGITDNGLYAVGGFNGLIPLPTLESFDPRTNTWAPAAPMPTARYHLATGIVNGILYAVGGQNGIVHDTLEAYDPRTNTWTTVAPMPTARRALAVGVLNNILYAVGGWSSGPLPTLESFDPRTNTWAAAAPMPTARYNLAVGVLNNILYAVGGFTGNIFLQTLEAYDPRTNTWTTVAPMPTARWGLAAGALNSVLYAVGGIGNSGPLPTLESFDPRTNTWAAAAPMPTARGFVAAGALNSVLYAVGGSSPTDIVAALEAYTLAGEVTWSSSDQTVARIEPSGLAAGINPGTVVITATAKGTSGSTTLSVVMTVAGPNQPPDTLQASPSAPVLWPPNHNFYTVTVLGVTDPDKDPVTITMKRICSDEPLNSGNKKSPPDASGIGTSTAILKATRSGGGSGRNYQTIFEATDGRGGLSTGLVTVTVPHDQGNKAPSPPGPYLYCTP